MESLDDRPTGDPVEEAELLTRSGNRIHILEQLYRHGELDRDDLKEGADVSRTTLQRNLDVLTDRGWIRNSGVTYWITPCGEYVAEKVLALVEGIDVARKLRATFRGIPASALDVDLDHLADATVWTPAEGDPYVVVNRQVRLLKTMDSGRGVLRMVGLHAHEVAFEAIVQEGATGEFVVSPELAETLTSNPHYAPMTEEMLDTGRFELFVAGDEVPYSLAIVDGRVQIAVDEDGVPRAVLESGADEVREWAEGVYRDYRRQAMAIE